MNLSLNARKGFTLVELLVAITVIAILGGMLVYGLFPMLNRAREAAVYTELSQMDQAIESFKTKYGFYPPSFKGINAQPNPAAAFTRYVNRISPNHQENVAVWWTNVGSNINWQNGEDIVFWLSGLFQNKQFPLTGNGSIAKAYAANDVAGTPERDVFFEFKSDRLFINGVAAGYNQQSDAETRFLYLDAASYAATTSLSPDPFQPYSDQSNNPFNPQTFQLCAPGRDKIMGNGGAVNNLQPAGNPIVNLDNLCNFAGGTLEAFINSRSD